jgi:hypothetical protein
VTAEFACRANAKLLVGTDTSPIETPIANCQIVDIYSSYLAYLISESVRCGRSTACTIDAPR